MRKQRCTLKYVQSLPSTKNRNRRVPNRSVKPARLRRAAYFCSLAMKPHLPNDVAGAPLQVGEIVRVIGVPDLSGMSTHAQHESRPVFEHLVGKYKSICGFNEFGMVELSFVIRGKPIQHTTRCGLSLIWGERGSLLLTRRSSRPAYGGRLALAVERPISFAVTGCSWPIAGVLPSAGTVAPIALRTDFRGQSSAAVEPVAEPHPFWPRC